jgi:putative transposon-encoded protein
MTKEISAVKGGKIKIQDGVEEIYERKIVPSGNGASIVAPKKHIGKRAMVIVLED